MKKLRVLALMHADLVPPTDTAGIDIETAQWRTEYDVVKTLRGLGHEVRPLGVRSDLGVIRDAIEQWKPDVAFNLLEEFDGVAVYDQNVVSYLELLRVPYTGCNPRGLMLARDKALSKKILHYHRIPSPEFMVVPLGKPVRRPRSLQFPLIVKSLSEEASLGISQASIVEDDERLRERVGFIHSSVGSAAIVEKYIEGRELYLAMLGNHQIKVFPVWELVMDKLPEEARRIATQRVKWSRKYQDKYQIKSRVARDLPEGMEEKLFHLGRRIFRILGLNGYARIDLRLDKDNRVHVLEANPNPQIARGEDFADSAEHAGVNYGALLQRLITLGMQWRPADRGR